MKVALVTPGGFSPDGRHNVIPALVALAAELARRCDLEVFAFGGLGPVSRYSWGGATVHQLGDHTRDDPPRRGGAGVGRLLRIGGQLWRELRAAGAAAGRFDVIHALWATDPGLLAGLFGRLLRAPVVVSVAGGESVWLPDIGYGGARSRLGRARTDVVLRAAAAVTVGSEFARSLLAPHARARAEVVPLGIDVARLAAPPARPAGPPWRLLHVGSINRVKDHRTLLAAFAGIAARHDVTLDCVGEDTLGGEIHDHAARLGVGARVRFHGVVASDELAPLYRAAHVHVVSSRYESQSVAVLEAAAAGLPTVGTAVGLLPTMAALAPAAARTVAPGDAAALAAGVCGLLDDEPGRLAMGASAQAFARAHDAAATARAFDDIYRRVASRWDSRPR